MDTQDTLETLKSIAAIVYSLTSTLAILVGGVLAWRRWGREAPQAVRGNLSHEVTHTRLSRTKQLVHVRLCISNTGKVALVPQEAYTKIFQVAPVAGAFGKKLFGGKDPVDITRTNFDWPATGRRDYPVVEDEVRIDSGETDYLESDFLIPGSIRSVFVYSLATLDPNKPDVGWDVISFHEIGGS